jgi:hypothetical protein
MSPEVQAWIEGQKPDLVAAAEEYVDQSGIYVKKAGSDGEPMVSSAQLRNLLNVAQSERSLKVLVNFLRYQIGRGGRGWKHKSSGQGLETYLTGRVAGLCTDEDADRLHTARRELEALLAALFLGYVIREFTYVCGGREKQGHG